MKKTQKPLAFLPSTVRLLTTVELEATGGAGPQMTMTWITCTCTCACPTTRTRK